MKRLVLPFVLFALLSGGLATPAAAQTPSPLAYWQYSVGQVLVPLGGPMPDWRINIGGGAMTQPEFEGAKRYEINPSAVFDIRYRDIAFASDGEGLGLNLLRGTTYRAGIALSYDLGRDHHDDPRLRTLPNISPAPEMKVFAEAFILPFVLTAAVRQGLGGHNGMIADFGAYVPLPAAKDLYVFAGPTVSVANAKYMKSYFGVTPSQAVGSPLTPFAAHGGLKDAGFGVTAVYLLGDKWIFVASGAFERLLGNAAKSPIVETRSQFTLDLNLVYHF